MTEKELEAIKKKSLYSEEFSHEYKDNISTSKLNNLCLSVKKQLRVKNDVVVMVFFEVKESL